MKRTEYNRLAAYVVTDHDIETRLGEIVTLANSLGGPQIEVSVGRGYGLFAEKNYVRGQAVTIYSGKIHHKEVAGPYVAKVAGEKNKHIDGWSGFCLGDKGRWINEYDSDPVQRKNQANVSLGITVRATRDILQGEEFFADYGDEYDRDY